MAKIRVVLSGLYYPVAILRYFESALRNREDVELLTLGPYSGTYIPWGNGMELPEKYAIPPTIPLNRNLMGVRSMNPAFLKDQKELQDIDIWIQADSNFFFNERPPCRKNVHIAIDPHVLDYSVQRTKADYFFNMQAVYSHPNDIYLPYCASKYHHYEMPEVEKEYDVCLVGLQYQQRNELVAALRAEGISVFYTLGLGMDEYRLAYNKSRVAVSWSSKEDLIARVFEAGAMGLPLVTNRVPDLSLHFKEGEHYLGFDSVSEAVNSVKDLLENEVARLDMAYVLRRIVVLKHSYDHRINQILEMVGA